MEKNKNPPEENVDVFTIDLHQLDKEWCEHPRLYGKWAARLTESQEALERMEAAFELVKAELDMQIRKSPKKFGLETTTEAAIKNAIIGNTAYQVAQKRVLRAKNRVNHNQAMIRTLEHRKKALEKTVDLFIANYHSVPKAKGEMSREKVEEFQQNARKEKSRRANEKIRRGKEA